MSAKINVLERFKDVLTGIRGGRIDITGSFVLSTLGMVERHIESLEKNQGFGAQKRADIAAKLMPCYHPLSDMHHAAKYAVMAADALLEQLNGANKPTRLYTHKEKGGVYELVGETIGAGTSREQQNVVYRSMETGMLYHRTVKDFTAQMKLLED
ncbi:hypothetical protein pf16_08 [Pseudomonas phage pf16]|uniref:Uncharacterized protein n=1 Tax=Pseudomonas phage pf16 TaxID=1815630 RepID=A0A1S5R3G5_9CAUD|nr:hypothetical protein FDG98_gp007 [Pseudomonas phage pf16]AND74931.1 hypothetical protein pf16_08 [Pseudomonas phage pf16]